MVLRFLRAFKTSYTRLLPLRFGIRPTVLKGPRGGILTELRRDSRRSALQELTKPLSPECRQNHWGRFVRPSGTAVRATAIRVKGYSQFALHSRPSYEKLPVFRRSMLSASNKLSEDSVFPSGTLILSFTLANTSSAMRRRNG